MKKLVVCLLALMLLALAVPAQAALEYKYLYDATECFDRDMCWELGTKKLAELSDTYKTQIRVDIVSDTEGYTLEEYADVFYSGFGYGYPDTGDGILLMLLMEADDTGVTLKDFTLHCGGKNRKSLEGFLTLADTHLAPWLKAEAWAGDMAADNLALWDAVNAYIDCAAGFLSGELEPTLPEEAPAYVVDIPSLLTLEELTSLEEAAQAASAKHGLGIHIAIVTDFTADGSETVEKAAQGYYRENQLSSDGLLLLISRAEGDYTLLPQGRANQWFQEAQIGDLSDILLDRFAAGNPAKGLGDYIAHCDAILSGEVLPTEETIPAEPTEESGNANIYFPIVLAISAVLLLLIFFEAKRSKRQ